MLTPPHALFALLQKGEERFSARACPRGHASSVPLPVTVAVRHKPAAHTTSRGRG